jgi:hypothetical protein
MPVLKYRDFTGGMVPDIFSHKMEDNQATMLFNYRNWKSAASKVGGQEVEISSMPLSQPNMVDFWRQQLTQSTGYFITAKAGKVWQTAPDGTDLEITRSGGDYVNVIDGSALGNDTVWISTKLYGGLTYITSNEFITPQWVTNNAQLSPAGLLQDLPGWIWNDPLDTNPYVSQTAQCIRAFDNQLWAGNIVKKRQDGTLEYYPNLVLYSDKSTNISNTLGNYLPDTWEPNIGTTTTSSNWAGFVSLDTSDPVIDILPLRDTLIVFTVNEAYIIPKLQVPQQVVSPQRFSGVRGLLSNDCAVSFDGRCFFVTTDDIMLTTGASIDFTSLANQRIKDTFFNQYLTRNSNWQKNVFVRYNRFYNEVWLFYPSTASVDGSCDRALIWDVESAGWSMVEVPNIYGAVYAPTIGNGTTTGNRNWTGINYAFSRLHFQSSSQLLVQDIGYSRAWGASTSYQTIYEKVFDLEGTSDASKIKSIDSIFAFIQGTTDATMELKFSNIPFSNGVDWSTNDYSGVFTTIEDYKIDPQRNGRYIAIRILTNDSNEHNMTSLDFDVQQLGKRG